MVKETTTTWFLYPYSSKTPKSVKTVTRPFVNGQEKLNLTIMSTPNLAKDLVRLS